MKIKDYSITFNKEKYIVECEKKDKIRKWIWIVLFIILISRVLFTVAFCVSGSMAPTLRPGDITVNWRLPYLLGIHPQPKRGDIVYFRTEESHDMIGKRVIGVQGDTIVITGGKPMLNNVELDEKYLPEGTKTRGDSEHDIYFEVPKGCIFVMGDNRNYSRDSRMYDNPFIPVSNITSRVMFNLSTFSSVYKNVGDTFSEVPEGVTGEELETW